MNYEQDYSHSHCWEQKQPPACGITTQHKRCCLCSEKALETVPVTPQPENRCVHDVHGTDCFECFPSPQSEEWQKTFLVAARWIHYQCIPLKPDSTRER
jgi:hypothetical protein